MTTDADTMAVYVETIELDLPLPPIPVIDQIFCEPDFDITISLPWGTDLRSQVTGDRPETICNHVESLMGQVNSLLAQLGPFLLFIDVFLSVQTCIEAIPDCITELSPAPMVDCLSGLVEAILALLCALYPPLAFPSLILSIINFLKWSVVCLHDNLEALCEAVDRVTNLENIISGDASMVDAVPILQATRTNLQCQIGSTLSSATGMCAILSIVNSFIQLTNDLAGEELMPEVGCPEITVDTPCDEAVAALGALVNTLESFTAIIPEC